MEIIQVVCALIEWEGRVLCVQRSAQMPLPLKWEFPGGKVEAGETEAESLRREIREELNLEVEILTRLDPVDYQYPQSKPIRLIPYVCRIRQGLLHLKEHRQYLWLPKAVLLQLDWAEADRPIVEQYLLTA